MTRSCLGPRQDRDVQQFAPDETKTRRRHVLRPPSDQEYKPDAHTWNVANLPFHDYLIDKNSSGDEVANVNFYAVRPEATRIR